MHIKKYIFFIISIMVLFCISLNAMHDDFGAIGNEEPEVEQPLDPLVFAGTGLISDADLANYSQEQSALPLPQLSHMNSNGQSVASAAPQPSAAAQAGDATNSAMASDIGSKEQASSSSNNGSASVLGIPSMAGNASSSASSEKAKEDFYCHACKRNFVYAAACVSHKKSPKCLANAAIKPADRYCSICEYTFRGPDYLRQHLAAPGTADLHADKIKEREKKLANGNGMQSASNNSSYACSCGKSYQFTSQRRACKVGHQNRKQQRKYKLRKSDDYLPPKSKKHSAHAQEEEQHQSDFDEDVSYGKKPSPTQKKKAERSAQRASSANQ